MPNLDFARQSQFDYFYEGLSKRYPGLFTKDKESIFQFMEMPMEAGWTGGESQAAFNLADTVPAKLGGFYATGASRISLAYSSLLNSMYQAIGEKNTEYRSNKDLVKTHFARLDAATSEAMQYYQAWKGRNFGNNTTFKDWLENDVEAWTLNEKIDGIKKDIRRINANCEKIEGAMGKALSIAQENLSADVMVLRENNKSVPRTTVGGNLQDDIGRWKANKNQFDLNVTINKDQQITTPWHETVKTSVKAATCHPPVLESYINVQRLVLDQRYSLNVKAVGLEGYPISRGSWYNDTFVRPSMKLPEGATLNKDDFFGPTGSLHLIPTAILVIYHPVIELTISTKTYLDEFSNNTKLSGFPGPLMLFGLNFDVQASLKKGVLQKEETTTITILPPDDQPAQILGVTSINKSI